MRQTVTVVILAIPLLVCRPERPLYGCYAVIVGREESSGFYEVRKFEEPV